jgi:hypothetical protein
LLRAEAIAYLGLTPRQFQGYVNRYKIWANYHSWYHTEFFYRKDVEDLAARIEARQDRIRTRKLIHQLIVKDDICSCLQEMVERRCY